MSFTSTFVSNTGRLGDIASKFSGFFYGQLDNAETVGLWCDRAWDRQMSAASAAVGFIFSVSSWVQGDLEFDPIYAMGQFAIAVIERLTAADPTVCPPDVRAELHSAIADLEISIATIDAQEAKWANLPTASSFEHKVVEFRRPEPATNAKEGDRPGLMKLPQLKEYALKIGVSRTTVRKYGKLSSRNSWLEAIANHQAS